MTYCPPPPPRSWRDRLEIGIGLLGLFACQVAAYAAGLVILAAIMAAAIAAGFAP